MCFSRFSERPPLKRASTTSQKSMKPSLQHEVGCAKSDSFQLHCGMRYRGCKSSIALLRLESGSVRFHSDVPPHRRDRGIDAIDYELWDLIEKESGGNLSESVPQGLGHQLRQLKESFSRFQLRRRSPLLRDRSLVVKREIIQQCWDAFTIQINEQLSALCQQLGLLGVKDTPLLLIGGGANVPGLGTTIETTGWPGPVLQSPSPISQWYWGLLIRRESVDLDDDPQGDRHSTTRMPLRNATSYATLALSHACDHDLKDKVALSLMTSDIHITMLGASNSGKTSYMLAMYATMSLGYHGFTFTCQSHDEDINLSDAWDRLEAKGEFPNPSIDTRTFGFDCNFGFKKILSFSWYDYRGRAVMEPESQMGVADLHKRIHESDFLVVCLPSDDLLEHATGHRTKEAREVRRYGRRLSHFLHEYYQKNGATLPVVIALTKSDLCEQDDRPIAIKALRKLVSGLFSEKPDDDDTSDEPTTAINTPPPPDGWLVTLCWVTLGKGIGRLAPPRARGPRCNRSSLCPYSCSIRHLHDTEAHA